METQSEASRISQAAPPHLASRSALHHSSEAARFALAEVEAEQRLQHQQQQLQRSHLYSLGRMLVGLVILATAIAKLMNLDDASDALSSTDLSEAPLVMGVSIAIELLGGSLLLLGLWTRAVATGLLAYVALGLIVLMSAASNQNTPLMIATVGIGGGLLMVLAHGAGRWSLDHLRDALAHHRMAS